MAEELDRYALARHIYGDDSSADQFVDLVKANQEKFEALLATAVKADGQDGRPDSYVQWKGTELCADFTCPCGNGDHIDAAFAYNVQCGACGRRWEISPMLLVRERAADEDPDRAEATIYLGYGEFDGFSS